MDIVQWLMDNGGPIIQYRTATELMAHPAKDISELKNAVLKTKDVIKWMNNLVENGPIHHSKDIAFENAMGKLLEYGINSSFELFDKKVRRIIENGKWKKSKYDAIVALPFLIRAGYADSEEIKEIFLQRIEALYATACENDYEYFLKKDDKGNIPKAWQTKPVFRDKYFGTYELPSCYDLYSMAYYRTNDNILNKKIEKIIAYICDDKFQSIDKGYFWDKEKNRCYAGGKIWLACMTMPRQILLLQLYSRFASSVRTKWFQKYYADLLSYKTGLGTYKFPNTILMEKANSYYLYRGAHMSLGEGRKAGNAIEIESTFWMLKIQNNIQSIKEKINV